MHSIPMLIISLLSGLMVTMNDWAAKKSDVRFHLNDLYMGLLMTAWMVFINGVYQLKHQVMLPDLILSGLAIVVLTYFIRNQVFIDDSQYMKGMIPHHSMAILMSDKIREKTSDPYVQHIADEIIKTSGDEIAYIKSLGY